MVWDALTIKDLECENVQVGFLCLQIIHVFIGKVLEEFEAAKVIGVTGTHGSHTGLPGMLVSGAGGSHDGAVIAVAARMRGLC